MSENDYFEVRKLLSERRSEEAERIISELVEMSNGSITTKYWLLLITSELKRFKKEYVDAQRCLEEAIELSKIIELSSIQKGRVYGKLGTIFYKMKNYSDALPFFHQALYFTLDDLIRRNYYYSQILFCFHYLKQVKDFQRALKEGLKENFREPKLDTWGTTLDFIWTITHLSKESPWDNIVIESLEEVQTLISGNLALSLFEFAWARLKRNQYNHTQFIMHMKKSIKFCEPLSSSVLVSQKLNFATMLETPFGDYLRAKTLLLDCLKLVPNPTQRRLHILNKLGSNLRFNGEYKDAVRYLKEALEINKTIIGNTWQEAYTHNTLGMIYTLTGNNEQAKDHYNLSIELNQRENDTSGLGFSYGAMAWLESNQGNLKKAKKWYKTSITTFEKITEPPAIILLAYAELLSRMGRNHSNEINELITKARKQIWKYKKHLDMGRYYNTLGNIALNQKRLEEAQSEFSLAFEYSKSFEVEAQTLLGMTKVNLEFFVITDNLDFLSKAELFLSDLRLAARSSALIFGEVDLILGIINMYKNHFSKAEKKFKQVINYAQEHKFSSLENKALEQQEILQVMQSHEELQQIIISSKKSQVPQIKPIKEVIEYLNELMKLVSSQTADKRSRNERI